MPEFLNPGFLYALPAALLPVVIHLLNRRRYRRVPWAAMDYLVRAEQVSRRRIRWQNLLLLALRTAAVVLLVILFARPVVSGLLPGEAAAPGGRVVLLLDDSASMAETAGGRSALERARDYALAAAESLAGREAALVVHLASGDEPIFEAAPVGRDDLARLRQSLAAIEPTAGALEPGRRLPELAARSRGGELRFYLATDLRAADWGDAELEAEASRGLEALQERGPVVVVDVGREPGANLGVTGLLGLDRPVYARERTTLRLIVRNDGAAPSTPTTAGVRLHGPASGPLAPIAVPAVPAGGSRTVPFEVTPARPGAYAVSVALRSGDAFPADDRRQAAFDVREGLPVLVVEGRGGAQDGAAYFLRRALQPGQAGGPGPDVRLRSAAAGPPGDLPRYAAVFLCEVARPGRWAGPLADYVREGGRLVAFAGGQFEPDRWNAAEGLLPARLAGLVRAPEGATFRLAELDFAHPLLAPLEGWEALFGAARVDAFLRAEPLDGARVLARFDDPADSPAIVAAERGAGEVVLICTSADEQWTDWPRSEVARVSYLALVQWLAEQGHPAAPPSQNVAGIAALEPPAGSAPGLVLVAAVEGGERPRGSLTPPARPFAPGVWAWRPAAGGEAAAFVAVNPAPQERLAARADTALFARARLRAGSLRVARYGEGEAEAGLTAAPPQRRLWAALAGLIALVLAAESGLAFLFGRPGRSAR